MTFNVNFAKKIPKIRKIKFGITYISFGEKKFNIIKDIQKNTIFMF